MSISKKYLYHTKMALCMFKEASESAGRRTSPSGFFFVFNVFFFWYLKTYLISVRHIIWFLVLFFWWCTYKRYFSGNALLHSFQGKIQSLAVGHSDILETLSPKVRKRVEVLREIQVSLAQNSMRFGSVYCYQSSFL